MHNPGIHLTVFTARMSGCRSTVVQHGTWLGKVDGWWGGGGGGTGSGQCDLEERLLRLCVYGVGRLGGSMWVGFWCFCSMLYKWYHIPVRFWDSADDILSLPNFSGLSDPTIFFKMSVSICYTIWKWNLIIKGILEWDCYEYEIQLLEVGNVRSNCRQYWKVWARNEWKRKLWKWYLNDFGLLLSLETFIKRNLSNLLRLLRKKNGKVPPPPLYDEDVILWCQSYNLLN